MNEEWFLQLTLSELKTIERCLLNQSDEHIPLAEKVHGVIATAENWHTPLGENSGTLSGTLSGTPSRGELPDA